MNANLVRFSRILLVVLLIAMLFFVETREILKISFFLGIPFIFIMGFMRKQKQYSILWVISAVLLGIFSFYI